jgi:hypothetical protein
MSSLLLTVGGYLLWHGTVTAAWEQAITWMVTFLFTSAAASSAVKCFPSGFGRLLLEYSFLLAY